MEIGDLAIQLIRGLESIAKFEDIQALLREIVRHFNCTGIILWEVADGYGDIASRRLFVQGQYITGNHSPPFYELPMDSISASAVLAGEIASHAIKDGVWQVSVNHPEALAKLGIVAFATIPIQLHGGTKGKHDSALTLYRGDRAFLEEEIDALKQVASFFPSLYVAVLTKVSLNLISSVQEVLGHGHFPTGGYNADRLARETLSKVASVLKQRFHCLEVCIYAGDPAVDPPAFEIMASEWNWSVPPIGSYTFGQGGTGWVLKTGKPLQLLDLQHYMEDRPFYEKKYPEMQWRPNFDVEAETRRLLELGPDDKLPPLSYVCVPILHDNRVYGAIRCCVQKKGPYYFDDDLTQALASVADLAGDWWVHWLDEQKQAVEHENLLGLLSTLSKSNREALHQLESPQKDASAIVAGILAACRELVPELDAFQVWMKNGDRKELVLAGENTSHDGTVDKVRAATVSLAANLPGGRENALASVWATKEAREFDPGTSLFSLPDCQTCRWFAAAPIVVDDKPNGVLVFLSHSASRRTKSYVIAASFIARQLAVYETLRRQLQDLRDAHRLQGSLLLDFQHQIRSPVNMISYHAEMMLSKPHIYGAETLQTIIEASRRANSVAANLQLFVQLAQKIPPQAKIERVRPSYVFPLLEKTVSYLYSQKALRKELKFEVNPNWRSEMRPFIADLDRLDLAFDNLLDNAVKYSYPDTTVRIAGVAPPDGPEVYISFQNVGLRITPEDLLHLAGRGVRGTQAVQSHPEGTGIGLWMTSQVLKSMRGRLEIIPTNKHGVNEFRVWLERA